MHGTLTLHCEQSTPPTLGQPTKGPVYIPIAVGAVGRDGRDLPIRLRGAAASPASSSSSTTLLLPLLGAQQTFVLEGLPPGASRPVLSVRSAPDPTYWMSLEA